MREFGLEGFGQSIRFELMKKNIWVTNVAPSVMKGEVKSDYKARIKPFREKFLPLKLLMPILDYETVAKSIDDILKMDTPPARISLGSDARFYSLLQKLLPKRLFDFLIVNYLSR